MFQKRKRKENYNMSHIVAEQFFIWLFDVCM